MSKSWKMLFGRWGTGVSEGDDVRIDASTNSLQTVGYQHHEIHAGSDYDITEVYELPGDDLLDIQITTPAGTKLAHLTIDFFCEQPCEWWIYEDVEIKVAGTSITPRNHRRDAGDSSTLVAAYQINTSLANAEADTDTSGGIYVAHGKAGDTGGGGKKATSSPGGGDSREEWVLLADTEYSLRFDNLTGDSGYVAFHLDYYEHTDKH